VQQCCKYRVLKLLLQHCCIRFVHMGGLRKTKSVEVLLSLFEGDNVAWSAVDLVGHLGKFMNKTTVYRILDRFESEGIVHSFVDKEGLRWYAKSNVCSAGQHKDNHPHFRCKKCGKVKCLSIEFSISSDSSYVIDDAEIFLVGVCPECAT